MNGKAIGLGFAAYLGLLVLGLAIVGMNPSDTELNLVFGAAAVPGFVVTMAVVLRSPSHVPRENK
jgi:hypothetical protein